MRRSMPSDILGQIEANIDQNHPQLRGLYLRDVYIGVVCDLLGSIFLGEGNELIHPAHEIVSLRDSVVEKPET